MAAAKKARVESPATPVSSLQGLFSLKGLVAVLGRRESAGAEVVKAIQAANGVARFWKCDVLDKASLQNAKLEIEKTFGPADILVNCAGGNVAAATIGPKDSFFSLPAKAMQQVTDLNFVGTLLPTQVFGKDMAEKRKKGSIINISSMAALQTITRVCGYSASKAAVENFTKWLAVELAHKYGDKIRVNTIAPGFFLAEQNRKLLTNADGSLTSRGQTIMDATPMGRFGNPQELIGALIYLASPASSFVTGTSMIVDGVFSAFSGV